MKQHLLLIYFLLSWIGLSAQVVYGQVIPTAGLKAYYPFDATQGEVVQDATGQVSDAQLAGGRWRPGDGYDGRGSLELLQDKHVELPLNWQPQTFTVSFWLYPSTLRDYSQRVRGVCYSGWGAFYFHSATDGNIYVGTDLDHRLVIGGAISTANWHHYVFTFNKGVGTLYHNGQPAGSRSDMALPQAWQGLSLGNEGDTFYDELRVYDRALSASEAYALANYRPYLPHNAPAANTDLNWTLERSFDGDGNVVAESKQFTDGLGRPTQAQARNAATQQVFAAQTVYSTGGQPVLQTLAAPIDNQAFSYKDNFITPLDKSGPYGPGSFEGEKAKQPDDVASAQRGTLGYYYSQNNAEEPLTPSTKYPYSLQELYEGPLGGVRKTASPGDELRLGQGRESKSRSFTLRREFDDYLRLRPQFVPSSPLNTLECQGVKTVSVNPDGRESIVVSNKEGQTLVTCLSGGQYAPVPVAGWLNAPGFSNPYDYDTPAPAYMDVHIPAAGTVDVKFLLDQSAQANGTVRIVDLMTDDAREYPIKVSEGRELHVPLAPGFYRFVAVTGSMWTYYEARYGNFSYTYYDDAGRAVATVAPKGLAASNLLANESFEQDAANESGWQLYNAADRGSATYVQLGRLNNHAPAHTGQAYGIHYTSDPRGHSALTFQTLTNLPNGLYTARAWVKNTDINAWWPLETAALLVKEYDAANSQREVFLPKTGTTGDWVPVEITNIAVSNGKCTIGFYSITQAGERAGSWIAFDDVEFIHQPNLLRNNGFEQDAPGQSGWEVLNDGYRGSATFAQTAGGNNPAAHGGQSYGVHYSDHPNGHDSFTYQTLTDLPNGLYTARAWVKNSGIAPNYTIQVAELLAKEYDDLRSQLAVALPITGPAGNWVQVEVNNIPVRNGRCTVGLRSLALNNDWIAFDDVEFVRQPDFVTRNTYDTGSRLLATESQDEGRSDYVYARDGRIRFSQSALQRPAGRFSYSNYDEVGRVIESGEYTPGPLDAAGVEFETHQAYAAKEASSLFVEAEISTFSNQSGSANQGKAAASGGAVIGRLELAGNYVQFPASVAQGGIYELQIRYATGQAETRAMNLLVDGVFVRRLQFPSTGDWDSFATIRTILPLKAGLNPATIRLEVENVFPSGYIDLDYFRLVRPANSRLFVEAEDAALANDDLNRPTRNLVNASSGAAVGRLERVGNYVQFPVSVTQGGIHELQIRYATGQAETRAMNLLVNGVLVRRLQFPSTGDWGNFSTIYTDVQLAAGTTPNLIRLEVEDVFPSGYVDLDYFQVLSPVNSSLFQEAEDATIANSNPYGPNQPNRDVATANGKAAVGWLINQGNFVQFRLVVPQAGTYPLALRYATGDGAARTMSLLVNDGTATQLSFPGTNGWSAFQTFTSTVSLRAGLNLLRVQYRQGDSGNVDLDYLSVNTDNNTNNVATTPRQSVHDIVEDYTLLGGLAASRCSQRNQVWYDLPWDGSVDADHQNSQLGSRRQEFTIGAVAKTKNDNVTTWYSYDELGRVKWVVQDINGVGIKTLDYKYDFSGNVLEVAYQKDQADSFYHYYTYDAAQRLTAVNTSSDGTTRTLQAQYSYYLHGPLKRVQVASDLQGIDYVYTLQGALKSVNHSNMSLEPGHDSPKTTGVYKDLFALTLEYFNGDYRSRALNVTAPWLPGAPTTTHYDGTIQAAAWRTGASPDIQRLAYSYDEKSQLQNSVYSNWQQTNPTSTTYQLNSIVSATALQEGGLSYDQNGNMLSLRRTNQAGAVTDNFSYTYKPNTNQLKEVHKGSATGETVLDYDYDELGQMTRQRDEQGQRYLTYDVTGKTTGMYTDAAHTQPLVTFAYDDRGFRVSKTSYSASFVATRTTYYVRDVTGNILTVYDKPATTGVAQRSEVPLYGSGRLGTLTHLDDGTTAGTDDYRYELTDHLGNARVVFHRPTTDTSTEGFEGTAARYAFEALGNAIYGYASSSALSSPNVALLSTNGSLRRAVEVQKGDTVTFTAWARSAGSLYARTAEASPSPAPMASRVQPFLLLGAAATTDDTPVRLENGRLTRAQAGAGTWLGRLAVGLSYTLGSRRKATPAATLSSTSSVNAWIQYQVRNERGEAVGQPQKLFLSGDNSTAWQKLQLGVRVQQGGWVELIANSADASNSVMFDNLTVEQTGGLIVQEQHQYAFGAPLPGLSYTVGNRRYRYGYQGQYAENDDETGFESFELRLYNSRIGRWLSYDPEGQFDSPYVGMGNNPVSGVDPDGGFSGPGPQPFISGVRSGNGLLHGIGGIALNWQALSPIVAATGKALGKAASRALPQMASAAGVTIARAGIAEVAKRAAPEVIGGLSLGSATAIAPLVTIQGDRPDPIYTLRLGLLPSSNKNIRDPFADHLIVGLSAKESLLHDEETLWYEQTYRDYDFNKRGQIKAIFQQIKDPILLRRFRMLDMQESFKSIDYSQYRAALTVATLKTFEGPKMYNKLSNNCVTNVKPVLSAAGFNAPRYAVTPSQVYNWFNNNWFF